jgi:hypothetical protein
VLPEEPDDTDRSDPEEAGEGVERGYPGVADEVAPGTRDTTGEGDAKALYSRISLEDRNFDRELMGLAPTTLARLLLNRAVTAVLSFESARKAEPTGWPASRRSGSAT